MPDAMHGRKQRVECGKRRIRATVFGRENGIARFAGTAACDLLPALDGAWRAPARAPKQRSVTRAATHASAR
ncbi:hypothetical protein WT23_30170 [Burkholderia territorii]|nr:hypothetical protein WT23_30170 [Burkholderia territorii]